MRADQRQSRERPAIKPPKYCAENRPNDGEVEENRDESTLVPFLQRRLSAARAMGNMHQGWKGQEPNERGDACHLTLPLLPPVGPRKHQHHQNFTTHIFSTLLVVHATACSYMYLSMRPSAVSRTCCILREPPRPFSGSYWIYRMREIR